jgi:uncharacterized damage-inducible protein DinB
MKAMQAPDWHPHFATFARYGAWAIARLHGAVDRLTEDEYRRDAGLFFKSVHGTLNHLLVGEHHVWYPRFAEGISNRIALNAELEPDLVFMLQAESRAGAKTA